MFNDVGDTDTDADTDNGADANLILFVTVTIWASSYPACQTLNQAEN